MADFDFNVFLGCMMAEKRKNNALTCIMAAENGKQNWDKF